MKGRDVGTLPSNLVGKRKVVLECKLRSTGETLELVSQYSSVGYGRIAHRHINYWLELNGVKIAPDGTWLHLSTARKHYAAERYKMAERTIYRRRMEGRGNEGTEEVPS